jgi:hypothetical protein
VHGHHGATDSSYVLTADAFRATVRVVVTATNVDGTSAAASEPAPPVEAA